MNWPSILHFFLTLGSGIGAWFLYDLIKEFKEFKRETGRDISSLKRERDFFQQFVRGAELSMESKVMALNQSLEKGKTQFDKNFGAIENELDRIRYAVERAGDKAEKFDAFMRTTLKLCHTINERQKAFEKEVRGTITKGHGS